MSGDRRTLVANGVSVHYGGVVANDDLDLSCGPGEIVGLIGPNGAGKTTFIDALTGFVPARGTVVLAGARLDGSSAHRRARAGLARTWQTLELFRDLSVYENALVATERPGWSQALRDLFRPTVRVDAEVVQALELVGLGALAERMPDELSLGQRKLVGVARGIAARPLALLLDEPAAGLDSGESRVLGTHLRAVAETGTALLLVDHDMDLVLDLCDRVYVLDYGRMIASGTPQEVAADQRVIEAYLGSSGGEEGELG